MGAEASRLARIMRILCCLGQHQVWRERLDGRMRPRWRPPWTQMAIRSYSTAQGWGTSFKSLGKETSQGSTWARQAISSRTAGSRWARIRQAHTCTQMTAPVLLHHRCKPKCSDDAAKTPPRCRSFVHPGARSPGGARPLAPGEWSERSKCALPAESAPCGRPPRLAPASCLATAPHRRPPRRPRRGVARGTWSSRAVGTHTSTAADLTHRGRHALKEPKSK